MCNINFIKKNIRIIFTIVTFEIEENQNMIL